MSEGMLCQAGSASADNKAIFPEIVSQLQNSIVIVTVAVYTYHSGRSAIGLQALEERLYQQRDASAIDRHTGNDQFIGTKYGDFDLRLVVTSYSLTPTEKAEAIALRVLRVV